MTKQAVESTFAMWMQEHFADFTQADRRTVTTAKNQRIAALGEG